MMLCVANYCGRVCIHNPVGAEFDDPWLLVNHASKHEHLAYVEAPKSPSEALYGADFNAAYKAYLATTATLLDAQHVLKHARKERLVMDDNTERILPGQMAIPKPKFKVGQFVVARNYQDCARRVTKRTWNEKTWLYVCAGFTQHDPEEDFRAVTIDEIS